MKKNIKHILSQEKIGSIEWTDSVIKEADLFFDLIGNKDVYGEDYIEYLLDAMHSSGYANKTFEDSERYYTDWLLANEQRLDRAAKMGGKYAMGGKTKKKILDQHSLVRTKEFKNWFGDWEKSPETSSKVVDENGEPLIVYHGTTHKWSKYSTEKGTPHNFFGVGFYASSNYSDVEVNYKGLGPDLTKRVEFLADKLTEEEMGAKKIPYKKRGIVYEKNKEVAKKQLVGGRQEILEVYLSIKNPLILTDTWKGTNFSFLPTEDEETGDFKESVDLEKITNVINDLVYGKYSEYNLDINEITSSLTDIEDIKANDLIEKFKENSYLFDYLCCAEHGESLLNNFIRDIFIELGFDGVIDEIPEKRFKTMQIPGGATHYIVWNSTQIKSATDNSGKFDPNNPDIKFMNGGKTGEWDFKAEIQPSDIDLVNEKDYVKEQLLKDGIKVNDFDDIRPEKFYVEYNIEHELREYGIKSMGVNVKRIYGDIRVEWEEKFNVSEDVTFDVGSENKEWNIVSKIETDSESGLSSVSLYPTNLSIDFKEKNILITFKIS